MNEPLLQRTREEVVVILQQVDERERFDERSVCRS
jgi:hypothetical protein